MDIEDLERLTDLIYDAATEPDGWPDVAKSVSRIFGDAAFAIDVNASSGGADPFVVTLDFDDSLRDLHFEEYRSPMDNPGVAALLSRQVGAPIPLWSIYNRGTYDSDASSRALLKPQRFDKALLVPLQRGPQTLSYVNLFRRIEQDDFDDEEVRALRFIAKQLIRALRLRETSLRHNRTETNARKRAKEGWTIEGTLLVDHQGRILDGDANSLAILQSQRGLLVRHGKLCPNANKPNSNRSDFDQFLTSMTWPSPPYIVQGERGTVFIMTVVGPAARIHTISSHRNRFVTIRRVDRHGAVHVSELGLAYGLTNGEVRALAAVCNTSRIVEASNKLGVSKETMKSHMAKIYAKTGCQSLAELMRLVGRFQ